MKTIALLAVLCVAFAGLASAAGLPTTKHTWGKITLYNQDLLTAYVSNPTVDQSTLYLPPVDEEQLCYLVGAISGCSGCQLGTQNLCTWVGSDDANVVPFGEFYQCVPSKSADELITLGVVWDASYFCPVDPNDEKPFVNTLYSLEGANPAKTLVPERASLIHNTFHEMTFGDVEYRPWPVDRTSLYSEAGAMKLWGYYDYLFYPQGDFIRPTLDCASFNDRTLLDTQVLTDNVCDVNNTFIMHDAVFGTASVHTIMEELVQGALVTENDVYCLNAIWGSYLSTRCPEYGVAVSGISYSLYLSFYENCFPTGYRNVNLGPSKVNIALGVSIPFSIFGLPIVPDSTPFALETLSIPASAQFGDYTEIDEVDVESSYYEDYANWWCYD